MLRDVTVPIIRQTKHDIAFRTISQDDDDDIQEERSDDDSLERVSDDG